MLRNSFIIVCCLIAVSCTFINSQDFQHARTELTPVDTISVSGTYDKYLLQREKKRLYCLNKTAFKIDIFNTDDNKKINTIGGIGFGDNQFNNLTDISLSHDNHLLALDSFQKKIKQYSSEGEYLGSISLSNCSNPMLITVLDENNWIIFDDGTKELIQLSPSASGETQVLDKIFDIKPHKLYSTDKWIYLYSREDNKTLTYSDLGNFSETQDYFCFQFNETSFSLSKLITQVNNDKTKKIIWDENKVDVSGEFVIKSTDSRIIVLIPKTEEVNN